MSGCLPCICSCIPDRGHLLFPDADAGSDWDCSELTPTLKIRHVDMGWNSSIHQTEASSTPPHPFTLGKRNERERRAWSSVARTYFFSHLLRGSACLHSLSTRTQIRSPWPWPCNPLSPHLLAASTAPLSVCNQFSTSNSHSLVCFWFCVQFHFQMAENVWMRGSWGFGNNRFTKFGATRHVAGLEIGYLSIVGRELIGEFV